MWGSVTVIIHTFASIASRISAPEYVLSLHFRTIFIPLIHNDKTLGGKNSTFSYVVSELILIFLTDRIRNEVKVQLQANCTE